MSRKKNRQLRAMKPMVQQAEALSALIGEQLADQERDRLLTRPRSVTQKTTRHVDDVGDSARDITQKRGW